MLRPRRSESVPYYPDERQRTSGRLGRPASAKSWLRGGERYVACIFTDPLKVSTSYDKEQIGKVGARILDFAGNWKKITGDFWVLDCVTEGVKFDFLEPPKQCKMPWLIPMSADMLKVCDLEVEEGY